MQLTNFFLKLISSPEDASPTGGTWWNIWLFFQNLFHFLENFILAPTADTEQCKSRVSRSAPARGHAPYSRAASDTLRRVPQRQIQIFY